MSGASHLRAGLLDTQVELFDLVFTDDGAGGAAITTDSVATVWAWVRPADWKQQQAAGRLEQRITHAVTIRWDAALASGGFGPRARLKFTDRAGVERTLAIHTAVDPEEDGRWLELGCLEGGPL